MNIFFANYLHAFPHYTTSLLKEKILPALTDQQKKILTVPFLALSCITACYAIYQCSLRNAPSPNENDEESPPLSHKSFTPAFTQDQIDTATKLHDNAKKSNLITDVPLEKTIEMAKIAGECLISLSLKNTDVTDEQLQELIEVLPNLQALNLSSCYKLTDAAIKGLPSNLQALNLYGCAQLTNAAIKDLPKNLRKFQICLFKGLTDAAIQNLPKDLQELNLSYSSELTDAGLQNLPKNLRKLNISNCNQLTGAAITRLLTKDLHVVLN